MAQVYDGGMQALDAADWLSCHCAGPVTADGGRRGVQIHITAEDRPDILDAQRVMRQSDGKFQLTGRWQFGLVSADEAVVGLALHLASPVECALTLLFDLTEDLWILDLIALVGWVLVVAGPDCPQAAAGWYGTPWVNLDIPDDATRAMLTTVAQIGSLGS